MARSQSQAPHKLGAPPPRARASRASTRSEPPSQVAPRVRGGSFWQTPRTCRSALPFPHGSALLRSPRLPRQALWDQLGAGDTSKLLFPNFLVCIFIPPLESWERFVTLP